MDKIVSSRQHLEEDNNQGKQSGTATGMHEHLHPNKKKVLNRLARIEGHVRSIKNMVDTNRDCSEVLIQIAAVRKALDNTAKVILRDHLEHCILHAVKDGDGKKSLDDFELALDRYLH